MFKTCVSIKNIIFIICILLIQGFFKAEAHFLEFENGMDNVTFEEDYNFTLGQCLYANLTDVVATKFQGDPAPSQWAAIPSFITCDNGAENITWNYYDSSIQNYSFRAFYHNFSDPEGIVARSSGQIYVVDSGTNQVVELLYSVSSNTMSFVSQFGSLGNQPGQFNSPRQIAVDSSGNLYIADTVNQRIHGKIGSGLHFISRLRYIP